MAQVCALPDVIVLFIDLSRDNHVGADVEDIEVAPSTWDVLNGAMDASKPSTSGRAWAETASRDRASVPLPTEEVAVTVWVVVPAPAGVPEMVPVDASRERPEGRAGETDQVTAYPEESEKAREEAWPTRSWAAEGPETTGDWKTVMVTVAVSVPLLALAWIV